MKSQPLVLLLCLGCGIPLEAALLRPLSRGKDLPTPAPAPDCRKGLRAASGGFPCTRTSGENLLCPDGALEWIAVETDTRGCPTNEHATGRIPTRAGDTLRLPANIPLRARWTQSGALSELLFRFEPRFGAIRTDTGVALWSFDGKRHTLSAGGKARLGIGEPRLHPLPRGGSGELRLLERRGRTWNWIHADLQPLAELPNPSSSPHGTFLALLRPDSGGIRLEWVLPVPMRTSIDRLYALGVAGGDSIQLHPRVHLPGLLAGDTLLHGTPTPFLLRAWADHELYASGEALPFDAPPGFSQAPSSPVPNGTRAWTGFESPAGEPVVFALGDSLRWTFADSGGRFETEPPPLSPWGWVFDSGSPDGRPQPWKATASTVRIHWTDSVSGTGDFLLADSNGACIAWIDADIAPDDRSLSADRSTPTFPELSPAWSPLPQTLYGDDFLRLAGWHYLVQEPATLPLSGSSPVSSPAFGASSAEPDPIRPIRHLGWTCPDARGRYAPPQEGSRTEFHGIGTSHPFSFSLSLPR